MPCWLAGVTAYRVSQLGLVRFSSVWLSAGLVILGYFLLEYVSGLPNKVGVAPLYFASQYVTDWLSASVIALALIVLPVGKANSRQNNSLFCRICRYLGDLTYPIYALHMPILILITVVVPEVLGYSVGSMSQLVLYAWVISLLLGSAMDRYRSHWRRFFSLAIGLPGKLRKSINSASIG